MNLKHYFLLTLLILPCLLQSQETSNPQNIEEKADSLIDLTEESFDQNVLSDNNKRWFVMFYAPWCPHCQEATPILNQLAKALDGKVQIGRVDCDANPRIRDKYSIQGVPTFLYFNNDEIHQYEGDRTVEAWTEFINTGFKKTEDKKPEDIKVVEEEAHSLINQDRTDLNRENPEDITRNSQSFVELTNKNFDTQVKDDERWFVMFHIPWCRHCQDIMPQFDQLANSLQDQLKFGKVDCDTEDELREKYSIHSYPTFLYFDKGELRQYVGDKTVEAWTDFVNKGYITVDTINPEEEKVVEEDSTPANFEENPSQNNLTSEEHKLERPENITQLPEQLQDDALIELTDVNFNYKVLTDSGQKWFVMFYSPSCPYCQEAMPAFIELAKSLQNPKISVGRVDRDANSYLRNTYSISGHPIFLSFYGGEVRLYEGDKTVEAWRAFLTHDIRIPAIELQHENPTDISQQSPLQERPQLESSTQQPESIDYIVEQPPVQGRPEFESPENVTQQPVQESSQLESQQNITQPEGPDYSTQQPLVQESSQLESQQNITKQPESPENLTPQPPVQEIQRESPQNTTTELPALDWPLPTNSQNITLPEGPENVTQQPVQESSQLESQQNITQPEGPDYTTQQPPVQERPQIEGPQDLNKQPESPENITQPPVQETQQLESPQNKTIQLPVRERPLPTSSQNITQPEGPENIAQQPIQEISQLESQQNITKQPESPENITQPPAQETPQSESIESQNAGLVDLLEGNFADNVLSDNNKRWFVMFYAPWCPHCKDAMPAFGELANSLKDRVSVARVDCDANPGLRDKYSIQGYPTFLLFYKGEIHQYEGLRSVEAWTEFVTYDYKTSETQTPEENKIIEENSTPMPLEGPNKVPQEKTPEIPTEGTDYLINLNKKNFNAQVFKNEDERWLIMFYAPWCPHCKHALPAFRELAKALDGHVKVGRVDCDANPELRSRFSIQGYPTFLFFSRGEIRKFEGERTVQAWSDFVNEGYKKIEALEEDVHGITLFEGEKIHPGTKFFGMTPAMLIIGGALVGAMLLFCFLAISHRKHEDTTVAHAPLEESSMENDTKIQID